MNSLQRLQILDRNLTEFGSRSMQRLGRRNAANLNRAILQVDSEKGLYRVMTPPGSKKIAQDIVTRGNEAFNRAVVHNPKVPREKLVEAMAPTWGKTLSEAFRRKQLTEARLIVAHRLARSS